MTPPKHLWSGDWQAESDRAARREPPAVIPAPDERPAEPPATGPGRERPAPPSAQAAPRTRARERPRRWTPSFPVVLAMLAAIIAGVAIAAATSNESTGIVFGSGQPAYLGVQLSTDPSGAVVVSGIDSRSPAEAAGIQPGDLIASMDGRFVSAPGDIARIVAGHHAGDQIAIGLQRNLENITTRATLTAQPSSVAAAPSP